MPSMYGKISTHIDPIQINQSHGWYCWWFRNPAPVEEKVVYSIIYDGFYTSQVVNRTSEPSTVWVSLEYVLMSSTSARFQLLWWEDPCNSSRRIGAASGSRKKCGGKLLDMKVGWGGLRLNKGFVCFKTNVISHFKQRSVFLKQVLAELRHVAQLLCAKSPPWHCPKSQACFVSVILVRDLTPNTGLFWYMFTEARVCWMAVGDRSIICSGWEVLWSLHHGCSWQNRATGLSALLFSFHFCVPCPHPLLFCVWLRGCCSSQDSISVYVYIHIIYIYICKPIYLILETAKFSKFWRPSHGHIL